MIARPHIPVLTIPLEPSVGSAIDPLVEEISWVCWRLTNADPQAIKSDEHAAGLRGWLDLVLETLHDPGRVTFLAQVSSWSPRQPEGLEITFGVGSMGARGRSAPEAHAAGQLVRATTEEHVCFPYHLERIDPLELLATPRGQSSHGALVRQTLRPIQVSGQRLELLSRFNPAPDPFGKVALLLLERPVPTTVRTTALATELSVTDHLSLDQDLARIESLLKENSTHPEQRRYLERASATLVDLRASFDTPVFAGEIAVASDGHLPTGFLRSIGGAFTSSADVVRRRDRVLVAGGLHYLGGFEIERDPDRLEESLDGGIPLRGGLAERSLRDVVSLAESPIAWPIPHSRRPIPTIPARVLRPHLVPKELGAGFWIGTGLDGEPVHIPSSYANRHVFATGESGSGKSCHCINEALEALKNGEPFMIFDPHGAAAASIRARMASFDRDVVEISTRPECQTTLSPFPALLSDHSNLDEVLSGVGRFADAIAGTFPDAQWGGYRWRQNVMAIGSISSAYQLTLGEAIESFSDRSSRSRIIADAKLPANQLRTIRLLNEGTPGETAQLIDWTISKFDAVISGIGQRLLGRPGHGLELTALMGRGASVIVDLSGLSTAETVLIGGICLSGAIEASKDVHLETPYRVIVDEAPLFHAKAMASIFQEGRKFNLSLVLIAQSLSQFADPAMRDAVASAAVKIAFRQSALAAPDMANLLGVEPEELYDQPDFHAFVKVGRLGAVPVQMPRYEDSPEIAAPTPIPEAPPRAPHEADQPQTAPPDSPALTSPRNRLHGRDADDHMPMPAWIEQWLVSVEGATPPTASR